MTENFKPVEAPITEFQDFLGHAPCRSEMVASPYKASTMSCTCKMETNSMTGYDANGTLCIANCIIINISCSFMAGRFGPTLNNDNCKTDCSDYLHPENSS